MILDEYALIPDIFDSGSYSRPELASVCLSFLKEPLLNEALVSDLRGGDWSRFMRDNIGRWEGKGRELLIKVLRQRRLSEREPAGPGPCLDGASWVREALASHARAPFQGIIAPSSLAREFRGVGPLASAENITAAHWWRDRSPSVETSRTIEAYLGVLRPVLLRARSIMFIDRFLDPSDRRYGKFQQLLRSAGGRSPAPRIELHRVCYVGSGAGSQVMGDQHWETAFRSTLGSVLQAAGLSVEVFIWDDFHDRFLISDLVGIGVSNSFDITTNPAASMMWTRLGRHDRDNKQREFDRNSHRHRLVHHFWVT